MNAQLRKSPPVDYGVMPPALQEAFDRLAPSRKRIEEAARADDLRRVVYFASKKGLIKIGTTGNLLGRLCQFQLPDQVLAVAASADIGGYVLERYAHYVFRQTLSSGRELFAPSFELYDMIGEVNRNPLYLVNHFKASGAIVQLNASYRPLSIHFPSASEQKAA